MSLLADIFSIAALSLIAPADGATVPVLTPVQREYISQPMAERFALMNSRPARQKLCSQGDWQPPLRLAWNGPTNSVYSLEIGTSPGDMRRFAVSNRTEVFVTNLEVARQYTWRVSDGNTAAGGKFTTEDAPPRLIRVDGVWNFRDLGGWKGQNGQRVRQNRIFRAAGLRASARKQGDSFFNTQAKPGKQRISERGISVAREDLGVRTDLELRRPRETMFMTSSVLGADVKWVCEPIVAYDFIDNRVNGRRQFEKIFKLFLEEKNYPVLFHCSGGRDRTGTLAFLLGALLGVSEEDLCRDWESTVFAESSVAFGSSRIVGLVRYLKTLGAGSVNAGAVRYAEMCGITNEEIACFRGLMLEEDR